MTETITIAVKVFKKKALQRRREVGVFCYIYILYHHFDHLNILLSNFVKVMADKSNSKNPAEKPDGFTLKTDSDFHSHRTFNHKNLVKILMGIH